jgi:hypothetical protein
MEHTGMAKAGKAIPPSKPVTMALADTCNTARRKTPLASLKIMTISLCRRRFVSFMRSAAERTLIVDRRFARDEQCDCRVVCLVVAIIGIDLTSCNVRFWRQWVLGFGHALGRAAVQCQRSFGNPISFIDETTVFVGADEAGAAAER